MERKEISKNVHLNEWERHEALLSQVNGFDKSKLRKVQPRGLTNRFWAAIELYSSWWILGVILVYAFIIGATHYANEQGWFNDQVRPQLEPTLNEFSTTIDTIFN